MEQISATIRQGRAMCVTRNISKLTVALLHRAASEGTPQIWILCDGRKHCMPESATQFILCIALLLFNQTIHLKRKKIIARIRIQRNTLEVRYLHPARASYAQVAVLRTTIHHPQPACTKS
jgi:hypothetical protein